MPRGRAGPKDQEGPGPCFGQAEAAILCRGQAPWLAVFRGSSEKTLQRTMAPSQAPGAHGFWRVHLVHVPQSLLQRAWPSCSRIHTRAPGGPPAQGPALGAWPGHILLSQAWGFLCDWTPYTRTLPDFSLWGSGGNNLGSGAAVFWRVSWYNFCQG